MVPKRLLPFLLFFAIGLIVVDGYQDVAGHHEVAGQTMCQTSCNSHMVTPAVGSMPVIQQHQPFVTTEPVFQAIQISFSIFHPPKVLA